MVHVTESCPRMRNLDFLIPGQMHYKPDHCKYCEFVGNIAIIY